MLFYGPYDFLILIGVLIAGLASAKVSMTFNKYSKVRSLRGFTGAEAAREILDREGLYDVTIERVHGNLSDHYDPRGKVLRLSDSTYADASVAAVSVAAHECGHAIQHAKGYAPLHLRSLLVPITNLGSRIYWLFIVIGLLFSESSSSMWISIGIWCFGLTVIFQLVTLPVELNASSRAIKTMRNIGIVQTDEEETISKKVLGAAAMTYVAATFTAILQLLRLILIFGGRDRD